MKELTIKNKLVGKRVDLCLKNGLIVTVRVLQHKFSYGNNRYLVTPVTGSGEVWVQNINLK